MIAVRPTTWTVLVAIVTSLAIAVPRAHMTIRYPIVPSEVVRLRELGRQERELAQINRELDRAIHAINAAHRSGMEDGANAHQAGLLYEQAIRLERSIAGLESRID